MILHSQMIAEHLRRELAARFPATTFRVKVSPDMEIQWTDGPSAEQVRAITAPLRASRFDVSTQDFIPADDVTITCKGQQVTGRSMVETFFLRRSFRPEIEQKARLLWNHHTDLDINPDTMDWGADVEGLAVLGKAIRPGTAYSQIREICALLISLEQAADEPLHV